MDHHEKHEEHKGNEFEKLSRRVIGGAIEGHRILGPGFLEASYQRCLSRELELSGIAHQCEAPLPIHEAQILTCMKQWWQRQTPRHTLT